jgi:hypothetical protein
VLGQEAGAGGRGGQAGRQEQEGGGEELHGHLGQTSAVLCPGPDRLYKAWDRGMGDPGGK